MDVLRWVGLAIGVVILVATAMNMARTLIVPRPPRRALASALMGVLRDGFRLAARRLPTFEAKDRLLALSEPVALLALLAFWLASTLVGFGLVLWPLRPGEPGAGGLGGGLGGALVEAGSSMFTLGFASSGRPPVAGVDFVAAASGLVIVALQIAYLPALYGAFNRRETLVTLLQSRAGAPAWGPEVLARHQLVGILDDLPGFYSTWEVWAADVSESHTTYPSLLWFRSPHPLYSWVVGLLAVLDSAALYLALSPSRAPSQTRLCLRMGFSALRDIAGVLGIPFDPDPDPEGPLVLTWSEFREAVARLEEVGFPMERSAEDAWPHFRGWRINYESIAHRLADQVMAPPAPWSGPRRHLPVGAIPPRRPADRRPRGGEARLAATAGPRFDRHMDDREILDRIQSLVDDEHRLMDAAGAEGLGQADESRLRSLEVSLDQCWDLLRQRRARRRAGLDPDEAQTRAGETVEHYRQ